MTPSEIQSEIEKFESISDRLVQGDEGRHILIALTRAVWELALQNAMQTESTNRAAVYATAQALDNE